MEQQDVEEKGAQQNTVRGISWEGVVRKAEKEGTCNEDKWGDQERG